MLSPLIYWNADGDVVGTLDILVARDQEGHVLGLVDFGHYERAGDRLRRFGEAGWIDEAGNTHYASGAGTWPEWLEGGAAAFRVELAPKPAPARAQIVALVHKISGHRRERVAVEEAISAVPVVDGGQDIRHLVGGPQRPLVLDEHGKTVGRSPGAAGTPGDLRVLTKF
jgi:hypothetical protein